MKILKYILLLLLLLFIATSVFVVTLKPDFDVVRTKIINVPKSTIYNYVNDYRNWEDFAAWKDDDSEMKFEYPINTIGKSAFYSWKGKSGIGKITTFFAKKNDSIYQKFEYTDMPISEMFWSFKDTLGKTKITWRTKGKMSFGLKIINAIQGDVDTKIGTIYSRSLANIEEKLDFQINTYTVKINGFVVKEFGYYMQKNIWSKNTNVASNIQIMIPNLIAFLKKNKIETSGKPFVTYNSFDIPNGLTNFSVCAPIKEEIFTSSESEYTSGNLLSFQCIKSTLTGDYIHKNEVKSKSLEFIDKANLVLKEGLPIIEVYANYKKDTENPSKWVTEFYYPVKLKVVPKKIIKPVAEKTNVEPEKVPDEINIQ